MLNYRNEPYPNLKFEKKFKTDPKIINGMILPQETIIINLNENNKPLFLFFVYGQKFDQNIRSWLNNLNKFTRVTSFVFRINHCTYHT